MTNNDWFAVVLQNLPLPIIIAWLTANFIPYLSALVTKHPGWWTGVSTATLSIASGFFSTWAAQGQDFNWKVALGAAFGAWIVAALHHWKVLSGTSFEAKLYEFPRPRAVAVSATHPEGEAA